MQSQNRPDTSPGPRPDWSQPQSRPPEAAFTTTRQLRGRCRSCYGHKQLLRTGSCADNSADPTLILRGLGHSDLGQMTTDSSVCMLRICSKHVGIRCPMCAGSLVKLDISPWSCLIVGGSARDGCGTESPGQASSQIQPSQ